MSIIQQLYDKQNWYKFLHYKQELGHLSTQEEAALCEFINKEEYLDVLSKITNSGFSVPQKRFISKVKSGKKRVVYIFARKENYILKLLTFLLIRKYDYIFADNLYSFRAKMGVRRAVFALKNTQNLSTKYVYKSDIKDYFNSVNVYRLLSMLRIVMRDDIYTYELISSLLSDKRVLLPGGSLSYEDKGIMAGVPISSFLANVYLKDLDWHFQDKNILYARYSDDIIFFAKTTEERNVEIKYIYEYLHESHLKMNVDKEELTDPFHKWNFLGISFENGVFDISHISAKKLKMKMRRKSRALLRWKTRKGIDNIFATKAFVKIFNRKLYDNDNKTELTWSRWFFPIINTDTTLSEIDHYMQDCIRYIATGKRTRSRFRFSYDDMKQLGYRSLKHEYYMIQKSFNNKSDV